MSKIIENIKINDQYYIIKIKEKNNAKPGQFYMLRSWDLYPILSRPISVYDRDDETLSFLCKLKGKGTKLLYNLKVNDEILLEGPYGSSFPNVNGKIAMIGGGIGIAPLYYAAKFNKKRGNNVDIYFSLRGSEILRDELESVSDKFLLKVNERLTGCIDFNKYDYIFICGPDKMMEDTYRRTRNTKAKLYISAEKRMGCGMGICYVCTCKTKYGNKLVCKDGPVFKGEDFYG